MRILIIRNYPSYLNVCNSIYNIQELGLAKALVRKGNVCDIVLWTDSEEKDVCITFDVNKTITVFYRKSRVILKNAIYKRLKELIGQYDVIQCCEYNQLQSWFLAKKYPQKTVIYHGPYYSAFNKNYNTLCRFMDKLVLPTYKRKHTLFLVKSKLAEEFLLNKKIPCECISVPGVGIDAEALEISDNEVIPTALCEVSKVLEEFKLLYIGRLEERRNITFLFDVLQCLVKKNISVKLIMVGNGETDYCERCFDYAKRLGVEDSIYWVKKAEQKYLSYVYKECDAFLLPTRYEIFGMVLLEAMYFGLPTFTTYNGGSSTIMNENNGIVIKDFDAAKWAEAIISVLTDDSKRATISQNAHDMIATAYTWDALADKFLEVYKKRTEV